MRISDWSSDVCSSDLHRLDGLALLGAERGGDARVDTLEVVVEEGIVGGEGPGGPGGLVRRGAGAGRTESRGGKIFRYRCLLERSEEHTSELQSLMRKSYAVFCLTKKNTRKVCKRQTTAAWW